MDRLTARLRLRSLVKIIVGLTDFDLLEVAFLTKVYTLAGADVIDVAAAPATVRAAVCAVKAAAPGPAAAQRRPRIMVSAALAGDPHVEGPALTRDQRAAIVPETAGALADGIAACLDAGADLVELHAGGARDDALEEAVAALEPVLRGRYLSLCLGTHGLGSGRDAIRQTALVRAIHGPATIVQAEGLAAAGRDDPARPLQGLALAQALLAHTSAYVVVAGGANHWTRATADILGIHVHGIAAGTYARELVTPLRTAEPDGTEWEPIIRVASAFVERLRGRAR